MLADAQPGSSARLVVATHAAPASSSTSPDQLTATLRTPHSIAEMMSGDGATHDRHHAMFGRADSDEDGSEAGRAEGHGDDTSAERDASKSTDGQDSGSGQGTLTLCVHGCF